MVSAPDRSVGDRRSLLVTHPSPDLYGSDRQMLETLTAFLDEGWDVTVVLPSDGPLLPLIRERGARVVVTPFPVLAKSLLHPRRLPLFALRSLVAVVRGARMLRRERPGLVLVNTITNPTWLASAVLAGAPVLCHVHEAEEGQRRLVRWALSVPLLLARGIIANSHAARRNLVDVLPRLADRTVVVHNGVPQPPVEPDPPAPRSPEDPLRLVVVGRLSPRKGSDVALEALALVRAAGVDARLTFCGAVFPGYEWFEEQLRERASQPDLRGAVTFAGYVHPTWPALAESDVAVVPSRTEPFGNVAVEAQLSRRPVVVSAVQGLVEIVDGPSVGRAVVPDDAEALAAALLELAGDPALARSLADEGHASARRRFTLDHYRRAVVAAAHTLRGSRRVPGGSAARGEAPRVGRRPRLLRGTSRSAAGDRLRVLESFGPSGRQRNPYITMLAQAIEAEPSLELRHFSLKTALLGRYDVVHLHWPEVLVERRRPLRTLARQLLVLAVVLRWRLCRVPVVRTVHNLELPQGLSRREYRLLDLMDRQVVLRIRLNGHTPVPAGADVVTIPHGHYRHWFAEHPRAAAVPGRVAFVGLVRRYKGVESLIEAFRQLELPGASLTIAGRPSTTELEAELRELAGGDPRVSFRAEYLDEAAFALEVTSAQLVVLPYRHMHNSGATLAALSLARPVLVPDTAVNRELAAEVGEGWLRFIAGDAVTAADLRAALAVPTPAGEPDLSARDWAGTGAAHALAFARALDRGTGDRDR